ncbi:DUF4843 domain-containing protein [Sphingobacterium sp. LRF_L2]|uniref:DUF4843 domain-containing protein n=1 Tax=Sphingobacterium sp. LRF_L2 TaxID=3369421 RepID=UPI003F5FD798
MTKITYFISFLTSIILFSSCEKNLETYGYGTGLNFYYEQASDTLINRSFVYGDPEAITDTVWLVVETIGPLTENDRKIEFEQIEIDADAAIADKHFVAFDDPTLATSYVVPANQSTARIPIILKRDESLKTSLVNLSLRIKTNSDFEHTNPDRNVVKIVFTDKLEKPNNWAAYANYFFGKYGQEKHQWMINLTGEKWDDDYLNSIGFTSAGVNSNIDASYVLFLQDYFTKQLAAYNEERVNQQLDVLKESDGTAVSFSAYLGQ